MEAGDWANSMEFASFNRHAYDSVDDGPGDRVVADGAGQLHGLYTSYSGVPALDSSKAAADDDLDLAVSKLSELLSGGAGMLGGAGATVQDGPVAGTSDELVDEISRKLAEVMPEPSSGRISEEQRKRVFGDTLSSAKPPRHVSTRPSGAATAREMRSVKTPRKSKGPGTPSRSQDPGTPSSIIYQHEPAAEKSSSSVAKPVRKTNVDAMVARMDRYRQVQEEKLQAAQKRQVAEQLKEMKAKPEISKKSKKMQSNYVPIHERVNDIIKDKKENLNKINAERKKQENDTLRAPPKDIPQSHYKKNSAMVSRHRPNSAASQWTKEFQDKKREALDKKRDEQDQEQLKLALQNDGDRVPFQPKILPRSQKMARLQPSEGEDVGERLYKDSQKRRAKQTARERAQESSALDINERSRQTKPMGDVCNRLYEQGMKKERARRNIESDKWDQSTRVHKPTRLLDEEPMASSSSHESEVPFGAGVYMMPMSSAGPDSEAGYESPSTMPRTQASRSRSLPPASPPSVVNFVPYDPQYNDVLASSIHLFSHRRL